MLHHSGCPRLLCQTPDSHVHALVLVVGIEFKRSYFPCTAFLRTAGWITATDKTHNTRQTMQVTACARIAVRFLQPPL